MSGADVPSDTRIHIYQMLLHRLVETYYLESFEVLTGRDRSLPDYMQRELDADPPRSFDSYLKRTRLA